ncbi:hypothetical protein ACXYMO_04350 [Arenibacterium sp. CAU 1754]
MKPGFALSLSFDGITLLHRAAGGWRRVGETALDASDLTGELAVLRDKAGTLSDDGLRSKIILPNDQIKYLEVETGGRQGQDLLDHVRDVLDAATPYSVDDLAYDMAPEGDVMHIAAVARETLAEAEAFAVEHEFAPVSFVSIPGDQPYPGEPFFGTTEHAATILDGGAVEPDGIAVVVTGEAEYPAIQEEPAPDIPPAPVTGPQQPNVAEPEDLSPQDTAPDKPPAPVTETPAPEKAPPLQLGTSFASRRSGGTGAAPALDGAKRAGADTASVRPVAASSPRITFDAEPEAKDPDTGTTAPASGTITSPVLDIPEGPSEAETRAGLGGLLSRHRTKEAMAEAALAPVVADTAPALPTSQVPKTETARMTVFGAREDVVVGGKPKHLGLILTALLLLFLAGVALWASLFLDDGLAGLLGPDEKTTEVALAPSPEAEPPVTDAPVPAVQDTDPQTPGAPETGGPPEQAVTRDSAPAIQPEPDGPVLSDTDVAVLDALRSATETPQDTDLQMSLPDDGTEPDTDAIETAEEDALEEAAARYAASGIWETAPQSPETPAIIGMDDVFIAAIDRTDLSQDAVALPESDSFDTDAPVSSLNSPTAAGTRFALDARGLVAPSRDGTLNPEGVLVFAGKPARVPPAVPVRFETEPETNALRDRLAEVRPRLRPGNLSERAERTQLGGLTRIELGEVRPKLRPRSIQENQVVEEPEAAPTAQAVAASRRPDARPRNFAALVQRAQSAPKAIEVASVAPRTVKPSIPSSASVARQATLDNAINLRRINLIGVYGTPSNRRALVRLPSGRYKKVKVGDSIDGGRVVAIGDSELRYQKGGRNLTLKIPSG